MKDLSYYVGREQTYIKHLVLENYLERVAYNIFSFRSDFVYVDGFAGPWRSTDEKREDTSFVIAMQKLRRIRSGFAERGCTVDFRCFFVERDPTAYSELIRAVRDYDGEQITTQNAAFENSIGEIKQFIGSDFALVFIDPTGWTGYPLQRIAPLLRGIRGELIINFMYDDINRHLADPRPEQATSFSDLYASDSWHQEILHALDRGANREKTTLEVFVRQLQRVGDFPFVTHTRVLKPLSDRTYFYLVYATRHIKGLVEFRGVEEDAVQVQERTRADARQIYRVGKTGQEELFQASEIDDRAELIRRERELNLAEIRTRIRDTCASRRRVDYDEILARCLVLPFITKRDIDTHDVECARRDAIRVPGLSPRKRTLDMGQIIEVVDMGKIG